MVTPACNPRHQEPEAGGSQVPGYRRLGNKILFSKEKRKRVEGQQEGWLLRKDSFTKPEDLHEERSCNSLTSVYTCGTCVHACSHIHNKKKDTEFSF